MIFYPPSVSKRKCRSRTFTPRGSPQALCNSSCNLISNAMTPDQACSLHRDHSPCAVDCGLFLHRSTPSPIRTLQLPAGGGSHSRFGVRASATIVFETAQITTHLARKHRLHNFVTPTGSLAVHFPRPNLFVICHCLLPWESEDQLAPEWWGTVRRNESRVMKGSLMRISSSL